MRHKKIDHILVQWRTLYIIPILIHDDHSVHVMGMIVNHAQERDGSFLDKESIVKFAVEGHHEKHIAGWPIDVYTQILDQIGRNALMKGGIE